MQSSQPLKKSAVNDEETVQIQPHLPFDISSNENQLHLIDNDLNTLKILQEFKAGEFDDSKRFFLKNEAYFLQFAYAYDKILSLSNSRTRILAHQVECAHRIMSSLHQRYLIADEVGLGKTIEAGLIVKELMYRYSYKKILIVCPASLTIQWQQEMRSKFNEEFTVIDGKKLKKAAKKENPWKQLQKIIVSLDLIKNKSFEEDLKFIKWDMAIFDEAHRLRRDGKAVTLAYHTAEIISKRSKSLILLSATPFRGNIEELYYLIALLDPNILGPFISFQRDYCLPDADLSVLKHKISPVVIRRTKSEVGGFTKRFARTVRFDLYPDERLLYDETTRYVAEEFNKAKQTENRAVGFVMTVFQKLLDSSSRALTAAISRRIEHLHAVLKRCNANGVLEVISQSDEQDEDIEDENPNAMLENTSAKTASEIAGEIETLKRLSLIASRIQIDKKGEKLAALINDLKKKRHKKFLIFTQFMTTQNYISEILAGFSVVLFNGSMTSDEKEEAIRKFRDEAEILICTEAGGEGRNLQFCNIIINYDLPWSPLKIEQRIGRIHRFGQPYDVFIFNFATRDTVAERVLEVLQYKLRIFEESIGIPDILLGEFEDELNLNQIFMQMAAGSRKKNEIDKELESRLENAKKGFAKLSELTVTEHIDFNYDEYYRITLAERKFCNRRIERFVENLIEIDNCANEIFEKKNSSRLFMIKKTADENTPKVKMGTFDSVLALDHPELEFLAFGHPAIDFLVQDCQSRDFGGIVGIRPIMYPKSFIGMVFFYVASYKSREIRRELIPVAIFENIDISEFDQEEIERLACEQEYNFSDMSKRIHEIEKIQQNTDLFFDYSLKRLGKKIEKKIDDFVAEQDIRIDPELEKIKKSYDRRIIELEEKLSIQESQMKWYGRDMKSAITRTKKMIDLASRERDSLIFEYKNYLGIQYSTQLVSAGIICSV